MNFSKNCRTFLLIMIVSKGHTIFSQETIIWNALQLPVRLSSKWQMPVDFSYRTLGFSTAAYQYTFRSGIRRFINKTWSVASGLALFFTRTSFEKENREFGREFRVWEEGVADSKLGKNFVLQNRLRIEERFFEATSKYDKYTAIRFRYKLGISKFFKEKYKLQLAEEYMEHLTSGKFSFQRNRVYISCGYIIDPLTQIEAGYIWSATPDIRNYITISFQRTITFHENRNGHS
jgi:hypothetical protein